jgi:hypothetical protein
MSSSWHSGVSAKDAAAAVRDGIVRGLGPSEVHGIRDGTEIAGIQVRVRAEEDRQTVTERGCYGRDGDSDARGRVVDLNRTSEVRAVGTHHLGVAWEASALRAP